VFRIDTGPRIINKRAKTAKVYGRRSARRTIHISFAHSYNALPQPAEGKEQGPKSLAGGDCFSHEVKRVNRGTPPAAALAADCPNGEQSVSKLKQSKTTAPFF
jgi:hypothetical protein